MSREAVVETAAAELGKPNQAEYWAEALGKPQAAPTKLAWCGIFTLFCLHKAGLVLDTHWTFGVGYLSKLNLRKTTTPQPGDIGYRDQPFQHHFIVERADGSMVHSIDGNSGTHSTVNRCTHPIGSGCVYYSIASLVGEVVLPSPSQPLKVWVMPVMVQKSVNNLIMKHLDDHPPGLLTIDGIIGPKSTAALEWAQRELGVPVTGNPDAATCAALGI